MVAKPFFSIPIAVTLIV
jgi:hypothetical protein